MSERIATRIRHPGPFAPGDRVAIAIPITIAAILAITMRTSTITLVIATAMTRHAFVDRDGRVRRIEQDLHDMFHRPEQVTRRGEVG